jgi:hypothetical protein
VSGATDLPRCALKDVSGTAARELDDDAVSPQGVGPGSLETLVAPRGARGSTTAEARMGAS